MPETYTSQIARRHAFSFIEMLVAVLILSILMAVAIPMYLNAIADTEKKTCRANMHTIGNAVQAARISQRLADYTSFIGAVTIALVPDLQSVPGCPTGGSYTIAAGTSGSPFNVHCSIASHGDLQYGVDSQ